MKLSVGIVGLPNVGKSTLFQALTKTEVLIANYPFATIDPNIGVVAVPDERLEKLAVFSHSEKKVPAIVEFVDIAGLVRGANKGEGLGNQFLAHIREVDAVIYMVRAFEDSSILHVEARVDPKDDIEILTTELMLKDLETVEKHWQKLTRDVKGGNKDAINELPILEKVRDGLRDGVMAYKSFLSAENLAGEEVSSKKLKRDLQLLTSKRGIFVLNINERGVALAGTSPQFQKFLNSFNFPSIILSAREELDSAEFKEEERKEVGLGPAKLPELIRLAYETLGLITFFTTGEDETRAWTISQGTLAPQAAGVIHTDFEKKFICADVIQWNVLLESGSWSEGKAKGMVQTVGKEYVIKDGDVIEVKHGA